MTLSKCAVFTATELEKNPKATFEAPTHLTVKQVRELDSDDQSALLENVLNKVRSRVRQRRILIKPLFQDFDRTSTGTVSVLCCVLVL